MYVAFYARNPFISNGLSLAEKRARLRLRWFLLSVNTERLSVEEEKVHREKQSPVDLLFAYRRESPVRLSIGATVAQRWEKARVKYY